MTNFLDFAMTVWRHDESRYDSMVTDSPGGKVKDEPFQPPTVEEATQWLEELRRAHEEYLKKKDRASRRAFDEKQRKMGLRLRKMLFTKKIAEQFRVSETAVDLLAGKGQADGLRFHLCFDPSDSGVLHLAALPWELILHPRKDEQLFAAKDRWLVRYFETGDLIRELEGQGDVRVLLVAANPKIPRVPLLDLEKEVELVEESLEGTGCRVETYWKPSLSGLDERLKAGRHQILHFMGHGDFKPHSGTGLLAFEKEDGTAEVVSGLVLGSRLAAAAHHLKLVVLNTCLSGTLGQCTDHRAFASVSAALLSAGVPAVVAMQLSISDEGAAAFSRAFYGALGRREWVEAAVTEGRHALMATSGRRLEWATPVVFLRGRDGNLFGLPKELQPQLQHVGIRSFVGGFRAHMSESCEPILELGEYFDPETDWRRITDPELWNSAIAPRVKAFAKTIDDRRPLLIEIAAHNSINFLAGRELETKGGLDLKIRQGGRKGEDDDAWGPNLGEVPEGPLWVRGEEVEVDLEAGDVALAIGIVVPVLEDVEIYARDSGLAVRSIVPLEIAPRAGAASVLSGAHAVALADGVVDVVRELRARDRPERLHIFMAAPHTFAFFLGQLSRHLGALQLYEHGFGGPPGAYAPSVRIDALRWP